MEHWTEKAARRILDDATVRAYYLARFSKPPSQDATEARIAAIIEKFAEPLVNLLRESKREHEDPGPCCMTVCSPNEKCDCGADEWNAKIDEVLG